MHARYPVSSVKREKGTVLVIVLLVMVVLSLLGMTVVGMALTESNIAANWRDQTQAFYVAESGIESLFADLKALLINTPYPTPSQLPTGSSPTESSLAPGGGRAPANANYFFDFSGNPKATRVAYVRSAAPYSYHTTIAQGTFRGLQAITTDYLITAQVRGPRGTLDRVSQVVQYQEIPLFQFGIFYGKGIDLEISPAPVMTFTGPIHSNSNIYIFTWSSLNVDAYMTTTGHIYRYMKNDPSRQNNPMIKDANGTYQALNFDYESSVNFAGPWSESQWKAQALQTFGGKVLDKAMGVQEIVPPIPDLLNNSGNPDVVSHQLIERGVAGDSAALQSAKLYYQADLRIIDGIATDKNGGSVSLASCPAGTLTTVSFWDAHQGKTMTVRQVDVAKLTTCGKNPANGILYVADTGSAKGVRLVNGATLPSGGLSVVSENPVYIQGDYNTVSKKSASVMADFITVLSNNWVTNGSDGKGSQVYTNRPATATTVNAAFALGPAPNESTSTQSNGHFENSIGFLENWSGINFTYTGSIVGLWHSQQATGPWKCCPGTGYYYPPNRVWAFDLLFNTTLPPGTPKAIAFMRGRWSHGS